MASNFEMRQFSTGATRNPADAKIDPEGFISPEVTLRYCAYMHKHRVQPDGTLREPDNWQLGIPKGQFAKSLSRHILDFNLKHRGGKGLYPADSIEETLCAIIFNASGYLFEELKGRDVS